MKTMFSFPTARAFFFPVKYLGIPLTVSRSRKVGFQYLLDKVQKQDGGLERAQHHPRWKTYILTKAVLSSRLMHGAAAAQRAWRGGSHGACLSGSCCLMTGDASGILVVGMGKG